MKSLKLLNFIFLQLMKFCLPVFAALAFIDYFAVKYVIAEVNLNQASFEFILVKANVSLYFAIGFVLVLVAFTAMILRFYWQSKSIYTLFQIQEKDNSLYFSFLICGCLAVVMLWALQFIVIIGLYGLYTNSGPQPDGLFLAYMNYDFLRLLLPLTILEVVKLLFIMFSPVIASMFALISCLKYSFARLSFLIPWGLTIWQLTYNFKQKADESIFWNVFIIAVSLVAVIYFSKANYKLMYKKSIT